MTKETKQIIDDSGLNNLESIEEVLNLGDDFKSTREGRMFYQNYKNKIELMKQRATEAVLYCQRKFNEALNESLINEEPIEVSEERLFKATLNLRENRKWLIDITTIQDRLFKDEK